MKLEEIDEIDEIIEAFGPSLYRLCRRLSRNKADADDLYQETFVKLVESNNKFGYKRNQKSYLFSTAVYIWKSKCRKYYRRQRIAPAIDFDESDKYSIDGDMAADCINKELYGFLNAEIERLDDKLKLPLYLTYTSGLTAVEIASVMKIPAGTVKSRLFKARKLLKERLEEAGYEYN